MKILTDVDIQMSLHSCDLHFTFLHLAAWMWCMFSHHAPHEVCCLSNAATCNCYCNLFHIPEIHCR